MSAASGSEPANCTYALVVASAGEGGGAVLDQRAHARERHLCNCTRTQEQEQEQEREHEQEREQEQERGNYTLVAAGAYNNIPMVY